MSVGVYLNSVLEVLGSLASVANLAPMLALLGLCALGCIVGTIFYLVGGR